MVRSESATKSADLEKPVDGSSLWYGMYVPFAAMLARGGSGVKPHPQAPPKVMQHILSALAALALLACASDPGADGPDTAPAPSDSDGKDAETADGTPDDAPGSPDLPDVGPGPPDPIQLTAEGVVLADPPAVLWPFALSGDQRLPAQSCSPSESGLGCALEGGGAIELELHDGVLVNRVSLPTGAPISGLGLAGEVTLPDATSWLSNGFQSWSMSGFVALGPKPSKDALQGALRAQGDFEVIREGSELSWFYSIVGGGSSALLIGALTSANFKPWVHLSRAASGGPLYIELVSGGAGELVTSDGAPIEGERWMLTSGDDPQALLEAYGKALPSRRWDQPAPAEAGWNSWYELWDKVDAEAVAANVALAIDILAPWLLDEPDAEPLRFVVDDGWQQAWGTWLANDKFDPAGESMANTAASITALGHKAGIWLAPLLVDAQSALATEHPDWFVGGAHFTHLVHGKMLILDVTHPAVGAHLTEVVQRIVGWGFDLLKIDFLFAGTFESTERYAPATGMQAYHEALRIIREAAGEDVILLAVGAPGPPSFPHADAWRVGNDIAVESFGPGWPFVANQARKLAARWHLCWATLCDADPPLLRELPRAEVEAGAWVVALAGGAWFLSDDLRLLPEERYAWGHDDGRPQLGIGAVPAVPVDQFPAEPPTRLSSALEDQLGGGSSTHVLPELWVLPDGRRLGLNVTDEAVSLEGAEVPPRSALVLE